jgi:hypothetical protein
MTSTPGWLRRRCQVDDDATKVEGVDIGDKGVGCESRCIVYKGPKLLHVVITFHIERSEKPSGSFLGLIVMSH